MNCELYLCGTVPIDIHSAEHLDFFIYGVGLSAIGVEETPNDIKTLMADASKKNAVDDRIKELKAKSYLAKSETVRSIANSEIDFYRLLAKSQKQYNETRGKSGTRIVGCDDPNFQVSEHQKAISEYDKNKAELFERVLGLDEKGLENEIEKAYNHFRLASPSEVLIKYYEARDTDTAENIKKEIWIEENSSVGRKPAFAYLGNITHFDSRYPNVANKLIDFKPTRTRLCDVYSLKH